MVKMLSLFQEEKGNISEYQLRASLYDADYKQFFGRTWISSALSAKSDGQKAKLYVNQVN